MDELERCQKKLSDLMLIVRLGVAVLVGVTGVQSAAALRHVIRSRYTFEDIRLDVPAMTQFFLDYGIPLATVAGVLAVAALAATCVRPKRLWPIALGLATAVTFHLTAQFAQTAMHVPFLRLVEGIP